MKISFQIEYRTAWGEHLEVVVHAAQTSKAGDKRQELSTTDGVTWRGELSLPVTAKEVEYHYEVVADEKTLVSEWAVVPHQLAIPLGAKRLACVDRWRYLPENAYRYTSAYTEAFACHPYGTQPSVRSKKQLLLHVLAPEVPAGQTLAMLGNQAPLGEWQPGKEVRLTQTAPNDWFVALDCDKLTMPMEFKFLTLDATTGEQREWENHDNRCIETLWTETGMTMVVEQEPVSLPFGTWRGAGCVIPVFSIRTEQSYGVGDFGDIKKMVDWLAQTRQRVLQILPINDTTSNYTWKDSYPYNSISIYAFHPMYVNLSALPALKDKKKQTAYARAQKELNALPQVDYEKVNDVKRQYLHDSFDQDGAAVMATDDYKLFREQNEEWLVPYAAFSVLRDQNGTPDFRQWKTHSAYNASAVTRLVKDNPEANFYCYVQYLLHVQLLEACQYARSKGIVVKGDIPIGISRNSVEAWVEPHYFNMNGQAGAPPDAFSTNGQNWGFPTYNWEVMLADGCQWWMRRFRKMANYFDAYRIDHVLGFFRIWEIPLHSVHGLLGQFSPSLPMTVEEIESYGLPWRGAQYTRPYITDWVLTEIFGSRREEVKNNFLRKTSFECYEMLPEFDTQRKVEAHFIPILASEEMSPEERKAQEALRDGLYQLISNVLFVEDRKTAGTWHPRISAQNDYLYRTLNDWDKDAFNRLYNHYFYHRHNQFWYEEAMKKLPVLTSATRMLVCAEDLGMVPECVPWVMEALKILTLEIQSMPKNPSYDFGHLWENPYRSVATISTHDMSTLRGWWEEDAETTQRFYTDSLYQGGSAPHPMPGWLCEEVVRRHLECPSMLCLLSLQDWLSMDERVRFADPDAERINIPANPRHYWRWRMHRTVEQLMKETALNEKIESLITSYGR